MKDRRAGLTPEERAQAAADAGARLLALPQVGAAAAGGACVAGFAPVRAELDPRAALDAARAAGARVAFPRVDDTASPRLHLHVTASTAELRPGRFGIDEPDATAPEVPPAGVAVMVVPGLAFDAAGRRLGFGGGYYDELLAAPAEAGRRPAFVVGFGYDFQVVDVCPADDRDGRVDCVITEARVIHCPGVRMAP